MSTSMMMLGVTVKLFDQMSGGMRGIAGQVDGLRGKLKWLSDQAGAIGRGALGTGLIAAGTLAKPIAAFAALEDASTRLKSTMMDRNGMTGAFEQVNALAVKLGDRLPGTTADFLNMMATLKQFGITDQSILTGVGEATAYMAVLLKQTPEQAAEFAAKLKEATGVADADMLKFMDTIQRVYHQGVSATEMMYAFARSAGALKQMKIQGLEASREMSALYAILIKTGMSGETAGTGMGAILNTLMDAKKIREANDLLKQKGFKTLEFTDKKGNFLGVKNMVEQFEKLKALNPAQLAFILKKIFGGGQDQQMVATLINNGVEGYEKMTADMEKQADLQRRIAAVLRTLTNLWEAASGTFVNLMASLGEAVGDDLKQMTEWFGQLSEAIKGFIKENPVLAQWLGRIAMGLTALFIGGGALLMIVGVVGKAIGGLMLLGPAALFGLGMLAKLMTGLSVVGAFMLANPITIAVALLAAAAGLIYENWAPISAFFVELWAGIKATVTEAVTWIGSKMQALSDMLPEWVTKYTLPGAAIKLTGEALGPARPAGATPGGRETEVGGKVQIEVIGAPVGRVHAKSVNAAVPFDVDAGLTMVSP